MKATGIVRRIDDLGRVVIPKEIRRTLRIREGDPLEIFTESDGGVIFKKYSPMNELSEFSGQYSDVLSRATGMPVLISDRDQIISCAGIPKKEVFERRVSSELEDLMENRANYVASPNVAPLKPFEGAPTNASVIFPIIGSGDVSGSVILLLRESGGFATQTEIKLAQVAASFLGKQMEE